MASDATGDASLNSEPEATAEDALVYMVVVNHEEQYSIWPASRALPAGWRDEGRHGSESECLAYIDEVWTDMRPLSLRRAMDV